MKHHEANLPTLKTPPQAQVWLSGSDENLFREKTHQPPPKKRQENSLRLKFRKQDRLLKRHEFRRFRRNAKRIVGSRICLDIFQGTFLRLGITAPTRYGSAPERNRFKRLVREVFRLNRRKLPGNLELNVSPRQLAKKASFEDIQHELLTLLK